MRSAVLLAASMRMLLCSAQDTGTQAWKDSCDAYWSRQEAEFRSEASPLKEADKAHFDHIDRYPYDPHFRVLADFTPSTDGSVHAFKTSTDRLPQYRVLGTFTFELNGQACSLPVYQSVDLANRAGFERYLFLPFTDLTNGNETYGGGRYLDLLAPLTAPVVLDLNLAYNPYCAYNSGYSCPVPPKENHLKLEVKAGARKFHD